MTDGLRAYVERDPWDDYRWWVEKSGPVRYMRLAQGSAENRDAAREAARQALEAIRDPQREEVR